MNPLRHTMIGVALAATTILAAGTMSLSSSVRAATEAEMTVPATPEDHAAEAAKYDQEALELEAKATHHEKMARAYRARAGGGTKGAEGIRSLVNHCERLARAYREAAREAREMAKTHREMARPS